MRKVLASSVSICLPFQINQAADNLLSQPSFGNRRYNADYEHREDDICRRAKANARMLAASTADNIEIAKPSSANRRRRSRRYAAPVSVGGLHRQFAY